MSRRCPCFVNAVATLLGCCLLGAARADLPALSITDPGQGVYNYTANAAELSGLTWISNNIYRAISDDANQRKVYHLSISINPTDGRITSASVIGSNTVSTGYDLEGIAYHPGRGTLFISDEGQYPAGGYIREHRLSDGALLSTVTIPPRMLDDRNNYGFESLSWSGEALWTANEEALENESALSTASSGSLVRLQKFDSNFNAAGQWAYLTDSYGYDSPLTTAERSGVSDLLALPDGRLLVLERALGIGYIPSFRNRIYLVDFSGATDVTGIADLDNGGFTRVTKTLLWEKNMGSTTTHNFEGIALGPPLPMLGSNSYSVLLIADNGGGTNQHLYALVIHGVGPLLTPLQKWRQQYFGTTNDTGSAANDADPEGDGLLNLLEYAMGRNPTNTDAAGAVNLVVTGAVAGLTFNLTTNAPDVFVQMQQNTVGLHTNAWTTTGILDTRATNGAWIQVSAWVTNPPPADLTNLFLRLKATVP